MEVENEEKARALKHDDLVNFVLQRDVRLWCSKPAIFILGVVDGGIEGIEILVAENSIVDDVPLSARVVERVAVAFARKIQPLHCDVSDDNICRDVFLTSG